MSDVAVIFLPNLRSVVRIHQSEYNFTTVCILFGTYSVVFISISVPNKKNNEGKEQTAVHVPS